MPGLCAGCEVVVRGLDRFDFKGFFGIREVKVGLCGSEAVGSGEIWCAAGRGLVYWEPQLEVSLLSSAEMEAEFWESFRRLGPCCLVREKIASSAALES